MREMVKLARHLQTDYPERMGYYLEPELSGTRSSSATAIRCWRSIRRDRLRHRLFGGGRLFHCGGRQPRQKTPRTRHGRYGERQGAHRGIAPHHRMGVVLLRAAHALQGRRGDCRCFRLWRQCSTVPLVAGEQVDVLAEGQFAKTHRARRLYLAGAGAGGAGQGGRHAEDLERQAAAARGAGEDGGHGGRGYAACAGARCADRAVLLLDLRFARRAGRKAFRRPETSVSSGPTRLRWSADIVGRAAWRPLERKQDLSAAPGLFCMFEGGEGAGSRRRSGFWQTHCARAA